MPSQRNSISAESDPEKVGSQAFTKTLGRSLSVTSYNNASTKEGDLYSMDDIDPALDKKMGIVNKVCLLSHSPFQY
jgi:hypothetical protein